MGFVEEGDAIFLVGDCRDELGGSEYLFVEHGLEEGRPPHLDLERELNVQKFVLAGIRNGLIKSAHDCSDGGLAVAIAECCIAGNMGAGIEFPDTVEAADGTRLDAILFGESASRIVISVDAGESSAKPARNGAHVLNLAAVVSGRDRRRRHHVFPTTVWKRHCIRCSA